MPNSFGHHFPPEVERLIAEQEAKRTFSSDLDLALHSFWKSGVPPDEAARILREHWREEDDSGAAAI